MNKKILLLLLSSLPLAAAYRSAELLKKYAPYLEHGTYDQQNWQKFSVMPKSRYDTFLKAFELFEQNNGKVIVELGTTHSFVHGGLEGCDSNDIKYWTPDQAERWDWGAGCFTLMAAECLAHCNPTIHTIDSNPLAIHRCRIMTEPYKQHLAYHRTTSEAFLRSCQPNSIDLVYLDTGYMNPIEPTAQLQLREAKLVVERNLLTENGIILIDDVRNQNVQNDTTGLGKSRHAIPYLLSQGYEIIADEYQVMMRKKK